MYYDDPKGFLQWFVDNSTLSRLNIVSSQPTARAQVILQLMYSKRERMKKSKCAEIYLMVWAHQRYLVPSALVSFASGLSAIHSR